MAKEQNEHELPSLISNDISFKLDTLSSQSLPSTIENDTETNSLNNIQNEFAQLSPSIYSINSNQFSSIPYIDSSSLIDDQEIYDKKQSSSLSDFSRKISLSESDLLTSLHRNLNKQIIDNSSDDDILFLEWDKERNLFQDYINSLRKEIRVLLQERLEYQQQKTRSESKPIHDDQMKIDLLQKSLEEKNFVIEQLQTEYELMKEKNTNLIQKISLAQCDTKSYIGIIDELKQKISDLTVDLQNHVLVKRRLEISINNLENDCQIIDAERIRLTNDIKENQHNKQDLEKLLQKANVQIAEQGSTIEMLRSENVQVRSQLSTIQRRMFQEKQQIMDYLRQIENDLIEKEQIKQRESLLRQDYEQLKNSINQDQQKIGKLQEECSQLLQTIQTQNDEKNQFQSEIKNLYSHFLIPIQSDLSFDNIIQPIEKHFNDLQNQCDILTNQLNELRTMNINQPGDEKIQKLDNENELRQNLALLTTQCSQLNEANTAWQQFQQDQLENFRNKLRNNLPIENTVSFNEIAQLIVDYLNKLVNERDNLIQNLQTNEKISKDLRNQDAHSELLSFNSTKQIHVTPSEEIPIQNLTSVQSTPSLINEHDEELLQLRENIATLTIQCAQLNEANNSWQQFQQAQLENFRNKLQDYLYLDENFSFDQAAQLIVNQITKEREEFNQQYEELEKINDDLRSESATNLETIKQSYINTINELTQELLVIKEELDKRNVLFDTITSNDQEIFREDNPIDILRNRLGGYLSIDYNVSFDEIIQQIVDEIRKEQIDFNERYQELEKQNHDLRLESENNLETIRQSYLNTINELNAIIEQSIINNQEPDTQTIDSSSSESNLDEINRIYEELRNILPVSSEATLEEIISHINKLIKENNLFKEKELILTKDLEYVNQQLINVYHQCEQLQEYNKQLLIDKKDDEIKQENILLQNQCTQLDNANRAWQQFYDNQIDLIKNQFKDYLDFENNLNFDQIIQFIATEFQRLNTSSETATNGTNLSNQSSFDFQQNDQILNLQEEIKSLENQLKDNQSSIDLLKSQIHQNQLELFCEKLQDWIFINPNSTLEQIAQQIIDQLDSLQKQLSNYQYNESILAQNLEELNKKLFDVHKQYEEFRERENQIKEIQSDKNKSIEQNQTHSLWSISDDENLLNERLNEYINEISPLSLIQLSNNLKKECEQILSKQNFNLTSIQNIELNQLALIALYSLYNQHLIDEAKQLYNETIIRALKQEYELINNEKNDLIQQIELENLQSKEINDKLEREYKNLNKQNISLETNDQQQVNNNILQTIKDKIDQIVLERPELFPDFSDDTIEQFDDFIFAIENQAAQIDILKKELNTSPAVFSEKEIEQLIEEINQARADKSTADEEIHNLKSQLSGRDEYKERITSVSPMNQTIDNETQTENQQQDKFVQINNKLKRALQTIKEKIHRIVIERPELFPQMSDDTIERLDQLISAIENQANMIEILQTERDHAQQEINERSVKIEQFTSQTPLCEDYQSQIDQLQQNLSEKDEERTLLREHLDEIELELRKTLDDQTSTSNRFEVLLQERDVLIQQQSLQLSKFQHEIEQLREEIAQLKQAEISSDEDIQSFKETVEQQSQELKDLSDKYLSQVESQDEISRQKKEIEQQLNEHKNQIDTLIQERANLFEEIEKKTLPPIQTIDNESQTDDRQHEKLVQVNNKLKRVLHTFKDKIHRAVTERPELFDGIGEETSERLDHLISTVENQATQIDVLHAERDQVEEQQRNEIKQLQSSLETSQNQLDHERPMKLEQLSSPAENISSSIVEDYQKQIEQLQQNLFEKDNERTSLSERLNEIELELRKTLDDNALTMTKYESLVEERDALVKNEARHSSESQRAIQQLREQLAELKQPPDYRHVDVQTDEDIEVLHETIEQQFQQLKDLNERYATVSSQLESHAELIREKKEIEEQLNERVNQIDNLMKERANLLEEIEKKTLPSKQTIDNESQTDNRQHEKLVQLTNKLKRALQSFKDKIHRVITERPDLFDGIGEETSERLDHLIATVENQATQVNTLQAERDQADEKYQRQIKELRSLLEACQYELDNERQIKMERLVSAAPLSSSPIEDISSSIVEDYQKQIKKLQQNLSQKDDERTLLRERLNEVELELRKTIDDHISTMANYESLAEEREARYSAENQRKNEQLKKELAELKQSPDNQHVEVQTDEDIQGLHETIEQQSQQLKDLNEKTVTLSTQLEYQGELTRQKKEIEEQLNEYKYEIDNLMKERANLFEEIEKKTLPPKQTIDIESQTDDHQHEKLIQVNNKLKRVLQTFKDKIHRVATERPNLFDGVGEETSERLDHLISTVENQATQIDVLHAERDQVEEQLKTEINELQSSLETSQNELDNERQMKLEQLSSPSTENISPSIVEDYEKQIKQLQQNLSQKDDERILLREHLDEVELELRKTIDDHSSTMTKYDTLVEERDALVKQQTVHSAESQRKIEQLEEELAKLKQLPVTHHVLIQTDEDIKLLHDMIEQQSEQIKDLNEKNTTLSSQLESQAELDRQKKETEERMKDYQNQTETLMQERANLLEEIEKKTLPLIQTIENESQTDDREHEKLVEVNNKLKHVLQTFKDKMDAAVTAKPEIIDGIGEETSERLDHLISTVENQATQIDVLHAERDQVEEQLRNEIKQLQSSLETSQNQLDQEHQIKMEQLSAPPEDISTSIVEHYEKQIEQLHQNLSEKDNERSSLNERLNEMNFELKKTIDDHTSKSLKYEEKLQSLVQERDTLVEQKTLDSEEYQREIEQLKKDNDQILEELAELKQPVDFQHIEIQTDEDINVLHKLIEQQIEEIKILNQKCLDLSSQIDSYSELRSETDRQKNESEEQISNFKKQIENLMRERASLLEEIEKNTLSSVQTTDNESQTDDHTHEKLVQVNNKLKHALHVFQDKIHQVVTERPDLFDGIGEEPDERLDHLISIVENQTTQINVLQAERDQVQEQLQNEIKQLQSSLETSQNQLDNERRLKMEQLSSLAEDNSSIVEGYQKKIENLQQNLSEIDNERNSLNGRLNETDLELRKTFDDHASTMAKYETLVEQQTLYTTESQREIEQLKKELAELKQSPDYRHVEAQTDEDIKVLHETIEQQSQQLKDLDEKTATLSSQLESQAELTRQKKEIEEQLNEHKNQIDNLMGERAKLLEEIEKKTLPSVLTTENESQTDDRQHGKLVQVNNKLEHALQVFKDKIHQVVTGRPNLFDGVGEETSERLDHLISTVENQAAQIDVLHAEHDRVEEQLRRENKELQSSLEAYRYQIENERPTKTEQHVYASPADDTSSLIVENYQKQIEQLQQNLSEKDNERSSLSERLSKVECELRKTLDDYASAMAKCETLIEERDALGEQQTLCSTESQREIKQLKEELVELKKSLKDLNEKNTTLSSQLESQAKLKKKKKEIEERLTERENQIDNLLQERAKLLEEIENNIPSPIQTTENEVQTDDDGHEKLLEVNKSLKSALETMEDKIQHVITTRPDLFGEIDEQTNEHLDHLLSTIENQATQIAELQVEHDQTKVKYQHEINELQNSFDIYRKQTDKYISSLTPITHEIDTQTIDFPTIEDQNFDRRDSQTTESDDNDSNTWFDASPDITEKEEIKRKQFRDIDIQCELEKSSSLPSIDIEIENLKTKIQQIALEYPALFSTSNKNPSENLDEIICVIKNLQNEIKELQSSFDIYRNEIENERLIKMEELKSNHVYTQTLGLSIFEEHEKQVKKFQENELVYQREIKRLIEERNLLSQWKEEEELKKISNQIESRINLVEQNKQLTCPPLKINAEIQTMNNLDLLPSSDQSISRRIFEEEMLAWSKESEQLKRFVKQIQIENNKLKNITLKFENMIHDYMHENERLKQENHHLSWVNYSSIQKDNFTTSDKDVCYLTLKWLTYEVDHRVSNNEQLSVLTNNSEHDLKQQFNDNERQIKTIRVQNERLKNQLETYTIQFKHIQHEMSVKIQELSTVKDEIERLRTNEIQSRLEIDRLKSELQDDQFKIQKLEYELSNLKFKQSSKDNKSIDNLRELLELKERELNALKEKLDYTKQTHKIELQEALKANQFSLDNVKRFEKMDLCHEEKRRELETRLGKFCTITRPLINNQQLFIENPIININELRKLIADTDTQERITNSLSPIRDCLSLLEAQMKDLHHNIIENHARRSKRWKYKLGFECLSCESRWEVTHDIRDLQEACLDPNRFLESSIVEPMAGCSCPIMIDFIESDIRLCLDDILNDVIVRTTVT